VQAAAISHGRIQDVYEHAAEVMDVGGPEMAPHTPQRSERPGKAGPLL